MSVSKNVGKVDVPIVSSDAFGNPVDAGVGYARGTILSSSIDENRRLLHAQQVASDRVREHGLDSIAVFTGNQRDFPLRPSDIATIAEEWVGPSLMAEDLRAVAIEHLGGSEDDAATVFNRTSAGIVAVINSHAATGVVVSVVPTNGRSHSSVVRGCALAQASLIEVPEEGNWREVIATQKPPLVVITTVTSTLERLDDSVTTAVSQRANALGAVVFLDEAYGARLRPVLHGGRRSLEIGDAHIAITNCDKAGLSGPRAGVLVGRRDPVLAAATWAAEHGMEARAPIVAGALRSLQGFSPEDLITEAAAGRAIAEALSKRLGQAVQTTDLGPTIEEDALHQLVFDRSRVDLASSPLVPAETASALGMILLARHGILTVNTHGQPGARASLRLKPTLDAVRRGGGTERVIDAVVSSIGELVDQIGDVSYIEELLFGRHS